MQTTFIILTLINNHNKHSFIELKDIIYSYRNMENYTYII